MYYYYLNVLNYLKPSWLLGTRVISHGDFAATGKTPTQIRKTDSQVLPEAGWHWSYLGGTEKIREKLEAFAHQEFNTGYHKDPRHIEKCISKGRDLFDRKKMRYRAVPLDGSFPTYILENQDRFAHLIREPEGSWIKRTLSRLLP